MTLCFIMLCCAVPCFASSSRTAHSSKYEIQIVTVGWLSGVEVPCAFRGFASAGRRFRAAVAAVAESLPDAGVTRWAARRWTKRAISFRSGSKANPDESTFESRR